MLSEKVLHDNVAYPLYINAYFGEAQLHAMPKEEMDITVLRPENWVLTALIKDDVAAIEQVWGLDVDWVFQIMGIDQKLHGSYLYEILQACNSQKARKKFETNNSKALRKYEQQMRRPLDTTPIEIDDFAEFRELAYINLATPDEPFGVYEGDLLIDGKFWTLGAAKKFVNLYSGLNYVAKKVKHEPATHN